MNKEIEFLPNINLVVGINGSGKTSVLNVVSWLLQPSIAHLCMTEFSEITLDFLQDEVPARIRCTQTDTEFRLYLEGQPYVDFKPLVVQLARPAASIRTAAEREDIYGTYKSLRPDINEQKTWAALRRIFPLGGKTAVLKHVQVNPLNRKSLYLVDKDFDDLLGIALSLPNLVYLDRYCIENYVLEPKAIFRLIVAQKPSLTIARAKKDFDVQSFLQTSITDLRLLFVLFFLVQKHALGIQGAGQPVARFADDRVRWRISRPKVEQYRTEIEKQLSVIGINLADEVKNYDTQFELSESEDLVGENVSGKHLVALTLLKIRSIFRTPGVSVDSATFRLAEYCGFEDLGSVAHRIAAIIGT